ncbi:MAG: hypothetical protein O2924_02590 [Chloroflexi bacterium]|nr:hypothetical protein [Chloroflexota bacterium]
MGFLKGLFGGSKTEEAQEAHPPGEHHQMEPECVHTTVVPRWDNAEDMGKTEKVTVYHCEGCGTDFTPAELAAIRPA